MKVDKGVSVANIVPEKATSFESSRSNPGQGCTPRPAPPRPRGKWLPRAAPAPKIFNSAPPRPAPPRKKRALPRPAPPRKLPRGKNRGKCSYIIKSFWESKTFDQYF